MRDTLLIVILAGGASNRMGTDKALLRLPDGRTTLEWLVAAAHTVTARVIIAVEDVAHAERLRAGTSTALPTLLIDRTPGAGPLFALADVLAIDGIDAVLMLAVDTPLVRPAVLQMFCQAFFDSGADAVIPQINGTPQPLPALYAARLALRTEQLITEGYSSLRALLSDPATQVAELQESQLRAIDVDLRSFEGANTPEEWQRVLRYAAAEQINAG